MAALPLAGRARRRIEAVLMVLLVCGMSQQVLEGKRMFGVRGLCSLASSSPRTKTVRNLARKDESLVWVKRQKVGAEEQPRMA